VLLALTLIGWRTQEYWARAIISAPWTMLALIVEILAVWRLSPELGHAALYLRRRRFIRGIWSWFAPNCIGVAVRWDATEARLRHVAAFRQLASVVGAQTDRWREGCWLFLSYTATYNARQTTAVFAVPIIFDPLEVSAAIVDDETKAIVFSISPGRVEAPREPQHITEAIVGDPSPSAT